LAAKIEASETEARWAVPDQRGEADVPGEARGEVEVPGEVRGREGRT